VQALWNGANVILGVSNIQKMTKHTLALLIVWVGKMCCYIWVQVYVPYPDQKLSKTCMDFLVLTSYLVVYVL